MKVLLINILVLILFGCSNNESQLLKIDDIYEEYKNENFESYKEIYNEIQDSLNTWRSDSLGKVLYLMTEPHYQVDSVIIFNKDSSRFFTTINKRIVYRLDSIMDYIQEFGGAFLEDKWYFYNIPTTMPVSRIMYKNSLYLPYTFEELSYISHKYRFGNMLRKNSDNSIVLNEKPFNRKFFDLESGRSYEDEKEYRDSRLIKKKYHKNTRGKLRKETINEIKLEIEQSVRPTEPVKEVKERSWWDKMFGEPEKVKLFESEAWKNRHKKKK